MMTVKDVKEILDGHGIICSPQALEKLHNIYDENEKLKLLIGEFLSEISELEGSDSKYLGYHQRKLVNRLQQALENLNKTK